jgi:hypothetical protein
VLWLNMSGGHFDRALICQNGHVITSMLNSSPERHQKHCSECGALTLSACPGCKIQINGYHFVSGVISLAPYILPKFCHNCGEAYPWTMARLEAANELVMELDMLTDSEKSELSKSVEDMVKNGPNSQVASKKYLRLMSKAGKEAATMMRDIIVDILSEAIRKSVFGS